MKRFSLINKLRELLFLPSHLFVFLVFYLSSSKLLYFFQNKNNFVIFLEEKHISIFVFLGIFLCLASTFLFVYVSFIDKSKSFPSCISVKNNKELKGIYSYVRHPSYYIYFLITFGTAFALLDFFLFLIACFNHIFLYFYYIIEENEIKKINPYYSDYLKKTNRFFPTIRIKNITKIHNF
ncbi:MAG: methyltransferase [Candidatus Shapirobacteria bacterium]|jgi:protein-S-isoprenylcysteine O-methyltransferase Ste14